jgi:beta-aspartyl-peptidase (threonine type)
MLSKPPASHPSISANRRGISVTLLTRARNPSHLVRALYLSPSDAPHAFLSGATAESIGASLGTQLVDPSYFYTEHRWREHRRGLGLPEEPLPHKSKLESVPIDHFPVGTVGAVALDIRGCIATLTSTGGKTNKLVGRVGDTPCMGTGYWAEEWMTQGGIQRFLAKIMTLGRREPSAIGVSGTGDGDVSGPSLAFLSFQSTSCCPFPVFY